MTYEYRSHSLMTCSGGDGLVGESGSGGASTHDILVRFCHGLDGTERLSSQFLEKNQSSFHFVGVSLLSDGPDGKFPLLYTLLSGRQPVTTGAYPVG